MQSRDKAHISNVARSQNEVVTVTGTINCQRVSLGRRRSRVKDGYDRTTVAKDVDVVVVGTSLTIQNHGSRKCVGFCPNRIVHTKSVIPTRTKNRGRARDCFNINRITARATADLRIRPVRCSHKE